MSDGLNYLMKVRPEAMKSYFAFMREAGRHLDSRTRAIISVITKVDGQSEAGFRQYLTRALREGVTADEILDGLLAAFPTLGLSKIVWAMEILVEMDVPEFSPERLGQEAAWHDAAAEADIRGRSVTRLACDGREVFIRAAGADIAVYDSRCPHQVTNIPELAVNGDVLTCPRHHWQFDLKSGECIAVGDRPLTKLPHKIEGGRIWVYW